MLIPDLSVLLYELYSTMSYSIKPFPSYRMKTNNKTMKSQCFGQNIRTAELKMDVLSIKQFYIMIGTMLLGAIICGFLLCLSIMVSSEIRNQNTMYSKLKFYTQYFDRHVDYSDEDLMEQAMLGLSGYHLQRELTDAKH